MQILEYLRLAQQDRSPGTNAIRVAIVTNFTDDLLKKTLLGMCRHEHIDAHIYAVPYKQYLFALKDPGSELARLQPDITFISFDANAYHANEFTDPAHAPEVLDDVARFALAHVGSIVLCTIARPTSTQHRRIFNDHALVDGIDAFNARAHELARDTSNISLCDTDCLVRELGENKSRDLRGLFAFSQPWSHAFILSLAREWLTHVRQKAGRVRKCIVVDLDNTLWGGILGEAGPLGIETGPEYPGNAYLAFQRTLRSFFEHGVILAIASRNNPEDVAEAFAKNSHLVLTPEHFAAIEANWGSKADSLRRIAQELNIGLDSIIFIDDDPLNRDQVRAELPEVLVPEWSMPPEEYARAILELDAFHSQPLTEEDRERGTMYAQERVRKEARKEAPDLATYLSSLGIVIHMSINAATATHRVAQMTQKTNQCNLTTRRMTEPEVQEAMKNGLVYAGDIRDRYGTYGVTVLAIMRPVKDSVMEVDNFLMSCRVMGRRAEEAFFHAVVHDLAARGVKTMTARYIPTKKNPPAADLLPRLGFVETGRNDETIRYTLDVDEYLERTENATLPARVELAS